MNNESLERVEVLLHDVFVNACTCLDIYCMSVPESFLPGFNRRKLSDVGAEMCSGTCTVVSIEKGNL